MSRHVHVDRKVQFLNASQMRDKFPFHFKNENASCDHAFYGAYFQNLLQLSDHFQIHFQYFIIIFDNMVIRINQIFFLDFFD